MAIKRRSYRKKSKNVLRKNSKRIYRNKSTKSIRKKSKNIRKRYRKSKRNLRGGSPCVRHLGEQGLLSRTSDFPRNLPLTYMGTDDIKSVSNPYKVSV